MPEHIKLAKIDMLVRLGVDVNGKSRGKSALIWAKEQGEEKISEFLSHNGAVEERISKEEVEKITGEMCINIIWNCNLEMVKSYIEKGADINLKHGTFNDTSLFLVASHGDLECMEYMIDNGGDVNVINNKGHSILDYALVDGKIEIAELLTKEGISVNSENTKDITILMILAMAKDKHVWHKRALELAIDAGVDVNWQDSDGRTALMKAVETGDIVGMTVLIEKGADTQLVDKEGKTAIMFTKDENVKEEFIKARVKKMKELAKNKSTTFSKNILDR
jgi:ankyrin repeat protein